jgi:hypothetical protein
VAAHSAAVLSEERFEKSTAEVPHCSPARLAAT